MNDGTAEQESHHSPLSEETATFDAYMASHFDFEYEIVEPEIIADILTDTAMDFKLFGDITSVSLSNPYTYTVDNLRAYDYTE